jgi:hypothetical protein
VCCACPRPIAMGSTAALARPGAETTDSGRDDHRPSFESDPCPSPALYLDLGAYVPVYNSLRQPGLPALPSDASPGSDPFRPTPDRLVKTDAPIGCTLPFSPTAALSSTARARQLLCVQISKILSACKVMGSITHLCTRATCSHLPHSRERRLKLP